MNKLNQKNLGFALNQNKYHTARFFSGSRWVVKNLAAVGLLVVLVSLLSACTSIISASKSGNLERIMKSGKLVISTDPSYPPQSEKVEGEIRPENTKCSPTEFTANQFTGFDVDLGVEIAKRMALEPCFVTPTWEQVAAGSWTDRWDINAGSMTLTEERLQLFYFPQPYSTGPAVFLVNKDENHYTKPADLSGRKVGACEECPYLFYLEGTLKLPGGAPIDFVVNNPIIIAYRDNAAAIKVLGQGQGRLDAILMDEMESIQAIADGAPLKPLGEPVFYAYYGIAIDKNSTHDQLPFLQKVNEVIQAIHKDGTLLKFSEKYYGVDLTSVAGQFDVRSLGQLP